MKKVLQLSAINFLWLFLLNTANAQNGSKYVGNDGSLHVFEMYDDAGNRIKTAEEMGVKGNPLLYDGWGTGTVYYGNGKSFTDTGINFSLVEKKLYMTKEKKIFALILPITSFSLRFPSENGDSILFKFKKGYPSIDENDNTSFYRVLFEGDNMQLLQWNHKKVRDIYTYGSGREKEFELVQQLYVYFPKENMITAVKTAIPAIKKALPAYSESIETYITSHKINAKDYGQIVDLVAYLDKHK